VTSYRPTERNSLFVELSSSTEKATFKLIDEILNALNHEMMVGGRGSF